MQSMKFEQVQMDSVCVSSMRGGQLNPSLLSPKGKTATKQMKTFFFFYHILNVILLQSLEVPLMAPRFVLDP